MDGFVQAAPAVAERRRGQHTERARQHRGLVGEDVAEQVLGEHDIEVAWTTQQMHRRGVHQHVLQRHAREFVADHPGADLAPQPRGLEHVRLVHLGDLAAPSLGEAPGHARDALDLSHRIGALVERRRALAPLAAEVDTAGEFPHEQQVDALEQFRLER